MNNWKILTDTVKDFGICLNQSQVSLFKEYWRILDEYNSHTNLVSSSDQEIIIKKHFVDSLSIGLIKDQLNWDKKSRIIDIGIGGGFPGIPIIIANPQWSLLAVDSVGKKTKFIELLSQELGISDRVKVCNARSEDLGHMEEVREKFDICVARAVSKLDTLAEYCLPFVKKDGYFVAYKAKDIEEELNESKKAISILGGKVEKVISYILPDDEEIERKLILIKKIANTSAKYPRKAGIPKKQPLR